MASNKSHSELTREFTALSIVEVDSDSTFFPKSPFHQERKLATRGVIRKKPLTYNSEVPRRISNAQGASDQDQIVCETFKRKLFDTDLFCGNELESEKKRPFHPRACSTPDSTPVRSTFAHEDLSPIHVMDDQDSCDGDASIATSLTISADESSDSSESMCQFNYAFMEQWVQRSHSLPVPVMENSKLVQPMSFVDYVEERATKTKNSSVSGPRPEQLGNGCKSDVTESSIPLKMSFRELGLGLKFHTGLRIGTDDINRNNFRTTKSPVKSPQMSDRLAALNLEKQLLSPSGQEVLEGRYFRRHKSLEQCCGDLENLRMNSF